MDASLGDSSYSLSHRLLGDGKDFWIRISLVALFLLIIFLLSSLRVALKPGLKSLPGPFWARFSNLYRVSMVLKGEAPDRFLEVHRKYGSIVRIGPNAVSISDVEAIPILFGISTRFVKSQFYTTLSPSYEGTIMDSLFTTRDPVAHKNLRKPVASKFSMTSIRSLEPLTDQCTEIFARAMSDLEGQAVDLGVWLQWYAFDVIGAITFRHRFGFMEERKDFKGMIAGIDAALPYAGIVGQIPALHPWLVGNEKLMSFLARIPFLYIPDPLRTMVQFTQKCIDEYDMEDRSGKQDEDHNSQDFLTWLRLEEQKGKGTMPPRDLMNHLSNNLLAGSDTTAISLRAVFYFVIRNPGVYMRLQKEIDEANKVGKLSTYITYAESLELEYLQCVLKEAMRCHPAVSFPLERVVPEGGATICGAKLPAGTVVGMNPVVVHHDTSIYGDDAAAFRPERWLDSDPEQIKTMDRNLLTFGYGTRVCIGRNISIMEMGKVVPQLLRQFDVSWASDQPEWKVKTYWFAKQSGLIVKFKTREEKGSA